MTIGISKSSNQYESRMSQFFFSPTFLSFEQLKKKTNFLLVKVFKVLSNHNKYYVIFREIRDPHMLLDALNPINQCNVKIGLTKP